MKTLVKDIDAIAESLAQLILKMVNSQQENLFHIALSGGNTPKLIFQYLAANYGSSLADHRFHFWWVDERCVPPSHDESNFKWAYDLWLGPIGIQQGNLHRIRGERNYLDEATDYADEVSRWINEEDGWPRFDLILLGLGEDGHTASIFPDQIQTLFKSAHNCEAVIHPGTGQKRVTMTGGVLNNSKKVVFIVSGEEKSQIVKEVVVDENPLYPASHVKPSSGEVCWLLDKAAGRLL